MAEEPKKKKLNKTTLNTTASNDTSTESTTKFAVITKDTDKKVYNNTKHESSSVAATAITKNANLAVRISSKPAKKVNKTSEMLETISNNKVNTNLDEVLKTVRQLDNICDFGRCRTKTSIIGQDCTLCQQRFCLKHQLPEVHGCGGAIKKEQRNEFLKPRPTLPAALRRNEQKDAHARLEQKLKEMSLARQKVRK
ncbi:DNA-binding protein SMUBP-2 [Contarinia nasturtii]|uniref:DNA-binding protein SMUBP-2 n=1 Tax=Contarinia nasturtii TaxID=265458 RepID=UPI0012D3C328|nr:DNA-binding protein SMUBP-2 [Contarinia nasturtii]